MCFFNTPSAPPPPIIPAAPAMPTNAGEQNQANTSNTVDQLRRQGGSQSSILTGGLGDSGYGKSAQAKTLLGS